VEGEKLIIVGIPAFNEEKYIAKVVLRSKKHADEVVVIDDGSQDMTAQIAMQMGAKVIRHARNLGKGEALRTLFEYAIERKADVLITLDGDGQHDPDEIPKLVAPILEGYDIVIGSRFLNKTSVPLYRRFGNKLLNRATNIALDKKMELSDTQSGFRAYRVSVLEELIPSERGMGADSEIAIKAARLGLRIKEVPISVTYGEDTSTYNPIYHALDVFATTIKLATIRHPLLLYGAPGIATFGVGLAVGVYAASEYLTSRYISFVLSYLAVTLIIVGLLATFTGVILYTMITVVRDAKKVLNLTPTNVVFDSQALKQENR
jgi:Glycosyltransferases involved in cell wall biogenesis